jgi:hypothetical protein
VGCNVKRTILYLLSHHEVAGGGDDAAMEAAAADARAIGIYTSRARADEAVARLREQPGFRDWPAGFRILEVGMDEDLWPDGFVP